MRRRRCRASVRRVSRPGLKPNRAHHNLTRRGSPWIPVPAPIRPTGKAGSSCWNLQWPPFPDWMAVVEARGRASGDRESGQHARHRLPHRAAGGEAIGPIWAMGRLVRRPGPAPLAMGRRRLACPPRPPCPMDLRGQRRPPVFQQDHFSVDNPDGIVWDGGGWRSHASAITKPNTITRN